MCFSFFHFLISAKTRVIPLFSLPKLFIFSFILCTSISCWVTVLWQTWSPKATHVYHLAVSVGQESRHGWARAPALDFPRWLSGCWQRGGLTWTSTGVCPKCMWLLACFHPLWVVGPRPHVLVDCWLEPPLSSCHMGLCTVAPWQPARVGPVAPGSPSASQGELEAVTVNLQGQLATCRLWATAQRWHGLSAWGQVSIVGGESSWGCMRTFTSSLFREPGLLQKYQLGLWQIFSALWMYHFLSHFMFT